MRAFLTTLFVGITLVLTFSKVGVVAFYQLNKAYVAQNLCVNKAKPALKCDGKCYLRKNVQSAPAEQAPAPAQLPELLKQLSQTVVFFQAIPSFHLQPYAHAPIQKYSILVVAEPVAAAVFFSSRLAADKPWHPPTA